MRFIDYFTEKLHPRQSMPFAEFMHYALYAPQVGYYSSQTHVLGAKGDFITAPELTPLFGYTLANQCAPILTSLTTPILLEFGAGSGQLCIDVLTALERQHSLPAAYHIMEVSPVLKAMQQARIQESIPELAERVHWLDKWPIQPFNGIILANEVLDAMPVHRFLHTEHGLLESMVKHSDTGNTLIETFEPCLNARLIEHTQQVLTDITPEQPYLSEANLFIDGWLKQCYACLTHGAVLLIDYGFPRHEYYHPERTQGTLMCHTQHHSHTNPLHEPGTQDITAHVDFTHVAEAAHNVGFHVAGYTNQASFLLANHLLNLLESIPHENTRIQTTQAVKKLIEPHEMGELFKVMALTKHLDLPLMGFQLNDKRARL